MSASAKTRSEPSRSAQPVASRAIRSMHSSGGRLTGTPRISSREAPAEAGVRERPAGDGSGEAPAGDGVRERPAGDGSGEAPAGDRVSEAPATRPAWVPQ